MSGTPNNHKAYRQGPDEPGGEDNAELHANNHFAKEGAAYLAIEGQSYIWLDHEQTVALRDHLTEIIDSKEG